MAAKHALSQVTLVFTFSLLRNPSTNPGACVSLPGRSYWSRTLDQHMSSKVY
jgi:hypothetical protein